MADNKTTVSDITIIPTQIDKDKLILNNISPKPEIKKIGEIIDTALFMAKHKGNIFDVKQIIINFE